MLPTFVIGLREGLEAALIVGIVAAFLRKQGRRDLLRWVLVGVAVAVLLCVGVGVALEIYSRDLPQKQQEGLETVIGAIAVGMVTYMVVWMRRHARELKGQLEGLAADAMAGRSNAGRAMVLMAFLAVIREGLETVVFLLAAFNETGSSSAAGLGATLGIAVAIGLGYGIYRGGVRLNLSKFFRATGLVLVLVAAGLVVNALHTAHEAGWLNSGQGTTVDLTWLVEPGTVQASLLTGMLGIQTHPVVIEVVGWLVYLVPIGCYVAWPPGRAVPGRALARACAVAGGLAAVAATVLALVAPAQPDQRPTTSAAGVQAAGVQAAGVQAASVQAQVVSRSGVQAVVRTQARQPVAATTGGAQQFRLVSLGSVQHGGLATEAYRADVPGGTGADNRPATLDAGAVAVLNHGRLPIGILPTAGRIATSYRDVRTLTVWIDTRTDRVIDLVWTERVTATARTGGRSFVLGAPIADATKALPATAVASAVAAARAAHVQLDRRSLLDTLAVWCAVLAGVSLLAAAGFALAARRRSEADATVSEPVGTLVRS
jgi:high-affinity iron transporter